MFTAIIADDEPGSARLLRDALKATGQVEVIGQAANGVECLQLLEEMEPDVLFLDIQMGDPSGLDVAEIVLEGEKPPLIAFVTSHDGHAVRAFQLAAVDYVVKTLDIQEFEERIGTTVRRLQEALEHQTGPSPEDFREVLAQLSQRQLHTATRKLPIKDYEEGTVRLINPSEIICVERKDRRVVVRTKDKEFPTYFTIEKLAQRLSGDEFFRANPSALINLEFVEHLIPNGDGSYDVLLSPNGDTHDTIVITVSRARSKELMETLGV